MAESQAGASQRASSAAVFSLLCGALVWGVIWYPYRLLRDAGVDGVLAATATYTVAFVLGLVFFYRSLSAFSWSWGLAWLALASAGCNLGYVLATLNGEVVRVLLLFYLAPLWTVLLSRLLLGEQLNRFGVLVITLSLAGAATMLWHPHIGLPVPRDAADWFGLGAGFSFALLNVLSRHAHGASIETKSMAAFVGVVAVGGILLLGGVGSGAIGTFTARISTAPAAWHLIVLIGIVLVFVNLVVQYGLARIAANRAIVIMLSEVGFAALSSWLLADEVLGMREFTGGAMIVAASVFSAKMEGADPEFVKIT